MKTFYIQLDADNIIRDIIDYEHEDYLEIEADTPLPIGVNGGWYKWEGGKFVEYPELKPTNQTELEARINELEQIIDTLLGVEA